MTLICYALETYEYLGRVDGAGHMAAVEIIERLVRERDEARSSLVAATELARKADEVNGSLRWDNNVQGDTIDKIYEVLDASRESLRLSELAGEVARMRASGDDLANVACGLAGHPAPSDEERASMRAACVRWHAALAREACDGA